MIFHRQNHCYNHKFCAFGEDSSYLSEKIYIFFMQQSFACSIKLHRFFDRVKSSGERGIRTPGSHKATTVFKTAAFDRSASSPLISF